MSEADLIARIKVRWNTLIETSLQASTLPPAFLGALIANESGGDPACYRFEPGVYARLKEKVPGKDDDWYRTNATSFGLTQIMGENYAGTPFDLVKPEINIHEAVRMLNNFAAGYRLNLSKDFELLFRCWNTGRPTRDTFDPAYVSKGLARMQLYSQINVWKGGPS